MKMIFSKVLLSLMFSIFLAFNHTTACAANKTPAGILVLGDSLSGAYGINIDEGWVALLQQQITSEGYDYTVINASVSGDTTRTGLGRIDTALKSHRPAIVILALGGNDGLRGLAFSEIENSLATIIERCKKNDIKVLLVGVRLPPNYGAAYNQKFAELYQRLATRYDIPLVPRMLDHIAGHSELMQQDGIHPDTEAQPQVMKNVWSGLKMILDKESPGKPR
ncbi:MAG: arylesterase [Gammaproteobacteria bacterium]|nr:arylesterase [Gammaproteobacteria bacterium]